jgi:trk system potassium uptake protein TrkA
MAAEFAVIGLGVFGRSVALNLVRHGQSVLAIDSDESEVRTAASELDAVVCADATDENALRELHLDRMSCVVVAIGAEAMEASILATALLRQIGVPRIVGRSLSELHARVLLAVGAHEVVRPEQEMGERLARRLAQPNVLERLELGGDTVLAEVRVPEAFAGKTLVDLDMRRRFGILVVAIRRGGYIRAAAGAGERLESGDVLVIIGGPEAVGRVAALA